MLRRAVFLKCILAALAVFISSPAFAGDPLPGTPAEITATLAEVHSRLAKDTSGHVADYIPALGMADPNNFGLVIVDREGRVFEFGDTRVPFAIESISKVFALARAMEDSGRDTVLDTVGAYHTGLPFNSVIASTVRQVKKQNPFVNIGAIAATSFINGTSPEDKWRRELDTFSTFAGRPLAVNQTIYRSESETNQHNRALAWLYESYGFLRGDPMDATDRYTRACSVGITCRDLAIMGACLAAGGVNPLTGKRAVKKELVRDILSLMAITGMYDSSGPWFLKTGLPGKSGVGGGILAVVPNRFAIAAYSPPLDAFGNSVRGVKAVEMLTQKWKLHLLEVQ